MKSSAAPKKVAIHLEEAPKPAPLLKLGDLLEPAFARVLRRCEGKEQPIPLPWPSLNQHFGGGLWPGVHYLTKGTGIGGTQLALDAMLHAASRGVTSLYVGLEMGSFDLGVRAMGLQSGLPWSSLWTGKAGSSYLARAKDSIADLAELPIYVEVARPMGFAASDIVTAAERVRDEHPGEEPILGVVDFLQLVGDEPDGDDDLRQRIAKAAYALRESAVRLNVAWLAISSIARLSGRGLSELVHGALTYREDDNGCPIDRAVLEPDQIVGLGKESGEIEYSGDSVSVVARVTGSFDGRGCDVVFATAKGRATGAMWSPLRFTGHRYEECGDRGGRVVEIWRSAAEKKVAAKEARAAAKSQAKSEGALTDAIAIARFVLKNDGCTTTSARAVVGDQHRRWTPAKELLGLALAERKIGRSNALSLTASLLPEEVRACL